MEVDQMLDPAFPYGEQLLQFIWESGLYDAHDLRTTDGRKLEVIAAGHIQQHSGPDLDGALVRIDGQLWAGNVEVHIRASDWYVHQHHIDPAYDNVVLHAVHMHDADVRTDSGAMPPTVELRSRIDPGSITLHHDLMTSRAWVPCAERLSGVDRAHVRKWLDHILMERMERKNAEVCALYQRCGNDPAETFHHLLLRGLGAHVNKEPFGMLANCLPSKILRKYSDDLFRTEVLLFGQAGLLESEPLDDHGRRMQEEHRVLAQLHRLRPMPSGAWKFGRMRPANFPTVRIAQLARLLTRSKGPLSTLLDLYEIGAILEAFQVEADGYWVDHYRIGRRASPSRKRLARSAAEGLVINCVVPYLYAMGQIRGQHSMQDRALHLLRSLPAEVNGILQGWAEVGVRAESAAQGQALLELKKSHCSLRRCLFCAIGTEVHMRGRTTAV